MSDYDSPSVFSEVARTARKQHDCCECRIPIEAGVQYRHASGRWDGRWDNFKTCLSCYGMRGYLTDGYLFGGLRDAIWDLLDDGWRPPEGAAVPTWVTEVITDSDAER